MKDPKLDLVLHGENLLALERLTELLRPVRASILPLTCNGREALLEHQFGFILVADEGSHDGSRQRLLHLLSEIRGRARTIVIGSSTSTFELHRFMLVGVHGFIWYHDVKRQLKSAVAAIRRGRMWIPLQAAEKSAAQIEIEAEAASKRSFRQMLTAQESLILSLLARNLSNKEIGNQLRISEATVKFHVSNLFKKLGVRDRRSAAILGQASATSNPRANSNAPAGFGVGPAGPELVVHEAGQSPQPLTRVAKFGGQ